MESLDQCRRLKVCEKEMFFVMSLRLSDHMVLPHIASSSSFFRFRSDFLAFFARISYFKFLEFRNLIKQFALVGYATGYSQLGVTRLVGYLPSHVQRALMELIVKYLPHSIGFDSALLADKSRLLGILNINIETEILLQ